MSPQSILIGQIIVVFTTIILTTWYATQWVALQFDYDAYLGTGFASFGTHKIYAPWKLFQWWYQFDAYAPHIFSKGGQIAAGGGFGGIFFAVICSVWRGRASKALNTFGSSRWATNKQIKRVGLLEDTGVFLGRTKHDYIRHDGPEHVMAIAPTRSGKGVGLVVPTLLSWTDSAVVHDIKGENWQLTSGWRSTFSHCLLFDPTNTASAKYNPLLEVRKVLAALGNSRLSSNLNQIAKAANRGALPVTEELSLDLQSACLDIRAMRMALMMALGFQTSPDQGEYLIRYLVPYPPRMRGTVDKAVLAVM